MQIGIAKHSNLSARQKRNENLRAFRQLRDIRNKVIYDSVINEGRHDILLAELGYSFDPIHEILIWHQSTSKKTLQLAPRGCGKSTVGTVGSALVKILRDPNVRILFASDIVTHAHGFLSELKQCLEHPRVTEIFGNQIGNVWNEDAINVAGRTSPAKENTVMTTGVDSSITSAHFDVIYCDDLVTLKNARTEGGRHKVHQWFYTTLMPCVTDAETEIHVLGTRYHPDDLYNHFMVHDPYFKDTTQIIPAIRPDNDETNLSERWTTEELHALRESMGRIYFNAQMNQNAAGIQGYVFDDKFFRYVDNFPKKLVVFTGVDLAIGQKKENAKFAIVTIGVDPRTFNIYVLDYYHNKLSLKQQDDQIEKHYNNHDPLAVGIEANAYQASKVQSLKGDVYTSHIPAIPIFTDKDKMTRAERLSVRFERGEIFFHKSEKNGEMEEQLLNFPNGAYKDLLDALDIAIRTALRRKKKKRPRGSEPGLISPGRKRWQKRQ